MINIFCPAGIGDTSWVYQKLYDLAKTRDITIKAADWLPQRTFDFIDLLPNVTNGGYCAWSEFPNGSIDTNTDLSTLEDGKEYFVQCNKALEDGVKLSDIFPHQRTEFHYKPKFTPEHIETASEYINKAQGWPRIGVYASSYHDNDHSWTLEQWVEFLTLVRTDYPEACFLMIGAEWDTKSVALYDNLKSAGWNVVSSIGQHKIGITLSVIKQLDYFFSYPSGLGIMADVLETPCMMWFWPNNSHAFINSYPDPKSVESGRHINLLFGTVQESFDLFKEKGAAFVKPSLLNRKYHINSDNGVLQQSNPEPIAYDKTYFEKYSEYDCEAMSKLRYDHIKSVIGRNPKNILDVGYGNGAFLSYCNKNGLAQTFGYDVSSIPPPPPSIHVSSLSRYNYDVITMFDSLEHVPDINAVMSNLAPCNYLVVTVPCCRLYNSEGFEQWFENWKHRRENEHLWHFNNNSLVAFIEKYDYRAISVSGIEDDIRIPDEPTINILTVVFEKVAEPV